MESMTQQGRWNAPGQESESQKAAVTIEHYNTADRLLRAGKKLAIFVAAAAVGALIPVLHFGLVPGFLLLGFVLAVVALRQRQLVISASGICPHCGETAEVSIKQVPNFPMWVFCSQCKSRLHLH